MLPALVLADPIMNSNIAFGIANGYLLQLNSSGGGCAAVRFGCRNDRLCPITMCIIVIHLNLCYELDDVLHGQPERNGATLTAIDTNEPFTGLVPCH